MSDNQHLERTEQHPLAEAAEVRPGDTLIVRYARPTHMTPQHADDIRRRLTQRFPGVEIILIEADGLAVYRPDVGGQRE